MYRRCQWFPRSVSAHIRCRIRNPSICIPDQTPRATTAVQSEISLHWWIGVLDLCVLVRIWSVHDSQLYHNNLWSSVCVALVPTLIIHLCGQYEILAMYVEKIGTQHRDQWDNLIFYTNIKNNEYVTFKPKKRMNRMKPRARVQYDKHLYDKHYLRQIIQFHREIVEFKKRVCNLFELS